MYEPASERSNVSGQVGRGSLPGRLRGALVVLILQVLANGFVGWLVIQSLNEDASHGETDDGAGLAYFVGYLSLVLAAVLLVCVVYTFRPRPWARPVIITIETIAILSGLVTLISGSVSGVVGIALAIAVTAILANDEVRAWYQQDQPWR